MSLPVRNVLIRRWAAALVMLLSMMLIAGCSTSSVEERSASAVTVELPNYYAPGMVLQRGEKIHIRGIITSKGCGDAVSLTVRFTRGDKTYDSTEKVSLGKRFDIAVKSVPARLKPYALSFLVGDQVIDTIRDVYVGDVFVAAGQSNMELGYANYYKQPQSFANNVQGLFTVSNLPVQVNDRNIRFLVADHVTKGDELPLKAINKDGWLSADKANAQYLGYLPQLFAQQLRNRNTDVPIGIIQTAWGGTDIAEHMKGGHIYANHIAPLKGYGIAGILWYQGENDAAEQLPALQYEVRFTTLINQYRDVFGNADLPFLYVQLARYTGYAYTSIVRQAQLDVLHSGSLKSTKNLAMVVSIDTDKGTSTLIHPLGKDIIAERMASQWFALSTKTDMSSGPQALSATISINDSSTVTIDFRKGTSDGLQALRPNYIHSATSSTLLSASTETLQGFEVAGIDGVFHKANAAIHGTTVVVHSTEVPAISQVRYLWSGAPNSQSMLYNADWLPASPFVLAVHGSSVLYPS